MRGISVVMLIVWGVFLSAGTASAASGVAVAGIVSVVTSPNATQALERVAETGSIAGAANEANATFRGAVEHNASSPEAGGVSASGFMAPASNSSNMFLPAADAAPRGSGWGNYFQAVGVLLLILGILYMGLWALKRFGKLKSFGGRLSRQGLTVEGQFHIGPKKTLVVVRFLNKRLLLGVTDHHINLLTEMEADNDPTHTTDSADFGSILDEAGHKDSSS